jgi:hypothetical protein
MAASWRYAMTPQELKDLKIDARITAVEAVLATVLTGQTRSAAARKAILETLDQLSKNTDQVRIRGASPGYSDMISGELQEAVSGLVEFLKDHLRTH